MPELESIFALPKVTVIAATAIRWDAMHTLYPEWFAEFDSPHSHAQVLVEFAGRNCYQSWGRPSAKTATNSDYVRSILKKKHFSVFEHPVVSIDFQGITRSFTHELIRHRHFSYSQLSQRYVDGEDAQWALHPTLAELPQARSVMTDMHDMISQGYLMLCEIVKEAHPDWNVKQVREAARAVMPNAAETKVVVTGNMRAWRHFILMRASAGADREIRKVAVMVYRLLLAEAPDIFGDMVVNTLPDGDEVITSEFTEEEGY